MDGARRQDRAWLIRQMQSSRWLYLTGFGCIAASCITALLNPLVLKWLIDDVLPDRQWRLLAVCIGCFFILYVLQIATFWAANLATTRAVQRMVFHIRTELLEHLGTLAADYYERTSAGDILFRLEQDVEQIGELCIDIVPNAVRMILMMLLALGAMLFLNPILSCIVIPLIPTFVFLHRRFEPQLQQASSVVQELSGKRSTLLHELVPGITQLQLLGRERHQTRRFARAAAEVARATMSREIAAMRFSVATMMVVVLATVAILGYGSYEVMLGAFTVGALVAFYSYLASLFGPLSVAIQLYSRLHRVLASARRICEIEQSVPSVRDPAVPSLMAAEIQGAIRLNDVWFTYADGSPALSGVSFTVAPGDHVAIVGPTGSGKSTIAKLLVRLYESGRGAITIDDTDIRTVAVKDLRSKIAFIPQHPVLFRGTVRENLLLVRPDATLRELSHALEIAQLARISRANVLECPCGQLSGGEKQRVALARALLQQRSILMMDEATSALDPSSEAALLDALAESFPHKTILAISHREAVTRWATQVLVISAGKVAAQGSYSKLIRENPFYRSLWLQDAPQTPRRLEPQEKILMSPTSSHADRPLSNLKVTLSPAIRDAVNKDGAILLDVENGSCLSLNTVGARIWDMLKQQWTSERIVAALQHDFAGVPADQLCKDYYDFIHQLQSNRLVQVETK